MDVIAPPPGDLFSETNDNSVAILHTYGTARVLFTGDPEEGVRGERPLHEALNAQGSADCSQNDARRALTIICCCNSEQRCLAERLTLPLCFSRRGRLKERHVPSRN
jgi:hypothetical protein